MNWYSIFYWISVADGVKNFFDIFSNWATFFSTIFFIFYWIIFFVYKSEKRYTEEENGFKYWLTAVRRSFFTFLLLTIITWAGYVFVPSKKDALVIVAGGTVGNFITSDSSAKALPSEAIQLLREKIKEEIKETHLKDVVNKDTLQDKSKEELIEMLKKKEK